MSYSLTLHVLSPQGVSALVNFLVENEDIGSASFTEYENEQAVSDAFPAYDIENLSNMFHVIPCNNGHVIVGI